MFEKATRLKLRFETPRGALSAEDLWDLPLTSTRALNLNDIAIGLHHQMKNDTVSFVEDVDKPDAVLQLRFDVVKHVIEVKKAERKAADEARTKAEQKQKIMAILARKEDADLEGRSMDELRGLLASL